MVYSLGATKIHKQPYNIKLKPYLSRCYTNEPTEVLLNEVDSSISFDSIFSRVYIVKNIDCYRFPHYSKNDCFQN